MKRYPTGWSKQDERLYAAFKCRDFLHALALLNSIGDIAEKLQHHPDLGIRNYNELFVSTITHDTNTITDKDFELAVEINDLLDFQKLGNN